MLATDLKKFKSTTWDIIVPAKQHLYIYSTAPETQRIKMELNLYSLFQQKMLMTGRNAKHQPQLLPLLSSSYPIGDLTMWIQSSEISVS